MPDKYIALNNGVPTEVEPVASSAGAGDAGKMVALNTSGDIDQSMMPPGIAPDVANLATSEAVVAGDFVNIWNDAGTAKVRKADASTTGKHAHGYVLSGVASGATAEVFFESANNQVSGMVAGDVWLSAATPGGAVATPPDGAGNVIQKLGVAISATEINVELGQIYVLHAG